MKRILLSYLTPLALLFLAPSIQAPYAKATAVNTFYSGVTGPIGGSCNSDTQCNTEDGCSWITNQYNEYFSSGTCTGGSGSGGATNCSQSLLLCRYQWYYTLGGCAGSVSQENIYYVGGC